MDSFFFYFSYFFYEYEKNFLSYFLFFLLVIFVLFLSADETNLFYICNKKFSFVIILYKNKIKRNLKNEKHSKNEKTVGEKEQGWYKF